MKNMRDILSQVSPKDVTPGELIKSIRARLNITQDELCEVTGLKRENLSAIENDRIEMTVHYAELLGAALGVHPASILFPNGRHVKSKEILAVEKKGNALLKKKIAV
jgi:transcriptional regulator with XRE-family HTH domain